MLGAEGAVKFDGKARGSERGAARGAGKGAGEAEIRGEEAAIATGAIGWLTSSTDIDIKSAEAVQSKSDPSRRKRSLTSFSGKLVRAK